MLSADNRYGDVLATEVSPADGPFRCPACQKPVILKQGHIKISHFAHVPDAVCPYNSVGESEEHRSIKLEIRRQLLRISGVTDVRLERYLREVRPDISFVLNGILVAIEIQLSRLSRSKIKWRTEVYARKNIAVLWMPLFSMEPFQKRYAPKDWERYVHGLYFGKVYYWSEGLKLQPVKFEDYMLTSGMYPGKRYSKDFVTPSLLPPVLITDLTARWRKQWRDFPRAKLWCEPWNS
ncbi:MAG: competence protein CoiA [Ktedonobacteraceae bacterium]|nr:competence protein CoiA [Ktedonobacteraceae bacterium]